MKKLDYNYLVLFFLIMVFFSCKTEKEDSIKFEKFPQEISLKGKSVYLEKIPGIKKIVGLNDSIIIVSTYKGNDVFYLFNKYNLKIIKKAIKRGRGPNEIAWTTGSNLDNKKGILYIPSLGKRKILGFPVHILMNEEIEAPINFMNLPSKYNSYDQMKVITDSLVCISGFGNYHIIIINKKGKEKIKIGKMPPKPNGIKEVHYSNLYTRYFTYNSQKKQFAMCFNQTDKILSYNLKGNKIFEINGPDNIQLDYNNLYRSDEIKAYFNIRSDNNLIYCLYSGRKNFEFISDASTLDNVRKFYPKTIHIFDWEGNPKIKVNLNHECRDFIIDNETNKLITLSSGDTTFFVYDLIKIKEFL